MGLYDSRVLALLVLLFVVNGMLVHSASTPPPTTPIEERVEAVVRAVMACRRLPGLSVAFVRAGEEDAVLSAAYGWADANVKRNATRTTRFCLAGATQPFTAAALLKVLRDNASYTLDSTVQDVLPNFRLNDKSITHQLTLRDILAHRAGLAPFFGGLLLGYNLTRAEIVRRLRFVPSVASFRHSALPNPLLYVLAGQLVQELSGTTWEEVVTQNFFKPNQMRGSTFADRVSRWTDDFALPHALRDGQLTTLSYKVTGNVLRPVGPAASVCASSDDMVKWLKFLLRNGTNATGSNILHPEDIREMLNASNSNLKRSNTRGAQGTLPVDSTVSAYTLGWITGTYRGHRRLFINGFANSYGAFVSLLPDLGVGIFTAANGPSLAAMDNAFRSLHYWLMDLALDEEPWLDRKSVCSFPRPWLKPTAPRYKKKFTTRPPVKTAPDITKTTRRNYKTTTSTTENTLVTDKITSSVPEKSASLSQNSTVAQQTTLSFEATANDSPSPEHNSALPVKSTILKNISAGSRKNTSPIYDTTPATTTLPFSESSDSPETSDFPETSSLITERTDFTETSLNPGTSYFPELSSVITETSNLPEISLTPETSHLPETTPTSTETSDFTETVLNPRTSNFPETSPVNTKSSTLPDISSPIAKTSNFPETTLIPETYYFPETASVRHETYYFSDTASLGPETFYFPETASLSPETYYFLEMTRLPKTTTLRPKKPNESTNLPKGTRFHKTTSLSPKTSHLTETSSVSPKTTDIPKTTRSHKYLTSPNTFHFPESSPLNPETSFLPKTTQHKTISHNLKASHLRKTTPSPLESTTAVFGSRLSTTSPHKPLKKHGSSNKLATSPTIFTTDSVWPSQETASSTLNHVTQKMWDDTTLEQLVVNNTSMPTSFRQHLHAPAYNILDALVRAAASALRRPTSTPPSTTQQQPRTPPTMPWGSRLLVTTWSPRRKHPFRHLTRQRITKRPHLSLLLANGAAGRGRKRRQAAFATNQFPQHVGTYNHPFFGDLTISFNRTAGTLQMDYGFYGKAHLLPKRGNRTFVLHFFSALWYMSDSDDSRRLPLRLFVVQFESPSTEGIPNNVTIPLFEPRAPPVFTRISSS